MSCASRVVAVRARHDRLVPPSTPTTSLRHPARCALLLALGLALGLGTVPASADPSPAARTAPRVVAQVLPPIAQMGAGPADPAAARTVVSAELRPRLRGRPVVLERKRDGRWVTVDRTREDGDGRVSFVAPRLVGGRPVTYRVTAAAYHRLPARSSDPVRSTRWGAPAFLDTFDGDALGPAWQHRIPFYNPWGGRSCSKGDPAAVAVGGGTLRLGVVADPARAGERCQPVDAEGHPTSTATYEWRLNGHVSTQHAFDFRYGVAAARIRFQRPEGQHGAFWLQPRGLLEDQPTPWGAEIDVIEWYGAQPGTRSKLASAVHRHPAQAPTSTQTVGGPLPDPDRYLEGRGDRWWRNYHVFSVEWTPQEYVFRIDGQETLRTSQNVSHHPEFLILSMLSSDFELDRLGDASLPQHLDVDWVAAWPQRG